MRKSLLLLLPLLSWLVGCASPGPTITANVSPDADFSNVKTFNIMQPAGTDRPNGVRTPLTLMLAEAITAEMGNRNITQSDTPDLLVNFYSNSEDRLNVRSTPTASFHSSHRSRGRYSAWGGYTTTVRQYTVGTLVIDLVDPNSNTLVWEGIAQQRLSRNTREISQQQIDDVVKLIMAEFN